MLPGWNICVGVEKLAKTKEALGMPGSELDSVGPWL